MLFFYAGVCRGGKNLDALKLELEVVWGYSRRVLGTELKSSARELHTINHIVPTLQLIF